MPSDPGSAAGPCPPARGHFDVLGWDDGVLHVEGWMLLPDGGFDSFEVFLDGRRAQRAPVVSREREGRLFPSIPRAERCGFLFRLESAPARGDLEVHGLRSEAVRGCLRTPFKASLDRDIPVPPDHQMLRVAGSDHPHPFRIEGYRNYAELTDALTRHSPAPGVERILEWGCGCGRITTHLALDGRFTEVFATDLDPEAIAWCQAHIARARFRTCAPEPPLSYEGQSFDAVIAYSVFSHLPREAQRAWLDEVRRVLRPGGLLVATVHGEFAARFAAPDSGDELARRGILDATPDPSLDGIAPDGYYRCVFQTRAWTLRQWSRTMEVVDYRVAGAGAFQDLVVLRKGPARSFLRSLAERAGRLASATS